MSATPLLNRPPIAPERTSFPHGTILWDDEGEHILRFREYRVLRFHFLVFKVRASGCGY